MQELLDPRHACELRRKMLIVCGEKMLMRACACVVIFKYA